LPVDVGATGTSPALLSPAPLFNSLALRAGQGIGSSHIPSGVDLIDGGSMGLDLLEYLKDYERVIIIDAADMGLPPGTVKSFTPDDVLSLKSDKSFSLHSADVLGVIALGRTLGETLADITIIAVQPEFVGPKDGLSDAVTKSLPAVIEQAVSLIPVA
jgi:hydrogenase maturation protease